MRPHELIYSGASWCVRCDFDAISCQSRNLSTTLGLLASDLQNSRANKISCWSYEITAIWGVNFESNTISYWKYETAAFLYSIYETNTISCWKYTNVTLIYSTHETSAIGQWVYETSTVSYRACELVRSHAISHPSTRPLHSYTRYTRIHKSLRQETWNFIWNVEQMQTCNEPAIVHEYASHEPPESSGDRTSLHGVRQLRYSCWLFWEILH